MTQAPSAGEPASVLSVRPKQTHSMWTRDRVRLDADVYMPEGAGPFPVLLMRQPYGRAIASTVVYAHPIWYAAQGYIVVIQDVRGRGTSEGDFHLFQHEVEDGADTVAWAAQLPCSDGQVGMYGFSYQGMTQLYAAQAQPAALRAIAPAMVGYHPYADWAYENGALLLQAGLGWALQLAAETARLQQAPTDYQALAQAARQLPLSDPTPARPQVLRDHASASFFHDWLDHPEPDAYWESLTPDLSAVDLPMLHIGGWFDPYLRGDVRLYLEMAARSQHPQLFWIGPWGHLPWGRRSGGRDFGPQANSPIDRLQVRWFNALLKHRDGELWTEPPICWFEMGRDRWRSFEQWPPATHQSWELVSTGLASIDLRDGRLYPAASRKDAAATAAWDILVHDPWRPAPSWGGHAGVPAGSFERASVDCRSDVLTYTTPPLETPLSVAGIVTVSLNCTADAPSFDWGAVLSEVLPDGTVYNLTQGYARFEQPPSVAEVANEPRLPCHWPLQPTCFWVAAGRSLRLSLSAACYPAYLTNPGTGVTAADTGPMDARIITLSVKTGLDAGSSLSLPIVAS